MNNGIYEWGRLRYRKAKIFLYKFRSEKDFRAECENGVIKWIKANGIASVVSFLIACLIYFAIREMIDNVFEISVPVEIQTRENDEPFAVSPSTVLITLRGAYKDYTPVNPNLRKVVVAAPGPEAFDAEGIASVKIRHSSVKGVSGLTIQKISPDQVEVKRDRKGEFEFELSEPKSIGDPLHGHAELSFAITNKVIVSGGAMRLEQLKQGGYKFELEPVDVSGLGDYSSRKYVVYRRARILSPSIEWKLSFIPQEVLVRIEIKKEGKECPLPDMAVKLALPPSVTLPEEFEVIPSSVSVTLSGWTNIIDKVSSKNVAVYADVPDEFLKIPESGAVTNRVPLRVLAPSDISIWSTKTDPDSVSLIIKAPPKIEPVVVHEVETNALPVAESVLKTPEEEKKEDVPVAAGTADGDENEQAGAAVPPSAKPAEDK